MCAAVTPTEYPVNFTAAQSVEFLRLPRSPISSHASVGGDVDSRARPAPDKQPQNRAKPRTTCTAQPHLALWLIGSLLILVACGAPRRLPDHLLEPHSGPIVDLKFDQEGHTLVCASASEIQLWDMASRSRKRVLWRGGPTLTALSIGSTGQELFSGHNDGRIERWDLRSAGLIQTLRDDAPVESLALTSGGRLMATAGGRGVPARLWDLSEGKVIRTIPAEAVSRLATDDAGRKVLVAIPELKLQLLDVPTAGLLATLSPQGNWWESIAALAVSRDGRWAASGTNVGDLELWDLEGRRSMRRLRGHISTFRESEGILSVAFSPAGDLIASSGFDGTARVWDVKTGQLLNILSEQSQLALDWDPNRKILAQALEFARGGNVLASGHQDGKIRLWRLPGRVSDR